MQRIRTAYRIPAEYSGENRRLYKATRATVLVTLVAALVILLVMLRYK